MRITIKTRKQWRDWLKKNHLSKEKVLLISYKKHTGKNSINHRAQLEEALCFGWVDTTVKRIDDDRYSRTFVKRKENATWSKNTLSYGDKLLANDKMSPFGKKMFLLGKKKQPIDYGIPKTFTMPADLKKALLKNKTAKTTFDTYPPSTKKSYLKWLFIAKRPETRVKRIKEIIKAATEGKIV